jgi:hypothetical protein
MKKYNLIFSIILLFALSFSSCETWIDDTETEPLITTEGFFGTVTDLERILNGSYATLLGFEGEGLASAPFLINALNGDLVAPFPPNEGSISPQIMMLYQRQNALLGEESPGWNMIKYASRAINNANMVIDALENGSLENDPDFLYNQERMRGEAYLMRALANFEITKLVAKQYNIETSSSDLAGYYPLEPVYDKSDYLTERVSVEVAYQRMIEDVNQAIDLLPERWDLAYTPWGESFVYQSIYYWNCRRFNADVARALLAKLYFQMNDFTNARAACDALLGPTPGESLRYPLSDMRDLSKDVLGSKTQDPYGPYIPDVDTVGDDRDVPPSQELICDFYGSSEGYGPNVGRNAWGYYFTPSEDVEQGRSKLGEQGLGWFVMSEDFVDYLDWDYADSRFFFFVDEIEDEDYNYWYWPVKFALKGLNVLWYRSAEFFLMRAECNARLGNSEDAKLDLDYVRNRADLDNYDDDPFVFDNLVEEIIRERARELYLENNRYWDLIRLGALNGGNLPAGQRESGVPWDSPDLLFPMPELY